MSPSNLRREFGALTSSAGLGHWHPNELRHSAGSLLSAAGVPLEDIADLLGDTNTKMLEKHYRLP
jgi:integrase